MRCPHVVLPTAHELAEEAARRFAQAARDALQSRGEFVVALAGGQTPQGAYARLAAPPYLTTVPWPQVQVLWTDERCVPPDDTASNYRLAREALLDHVPVRAVNVHRIRGEDDPGASAWAYERSVRAVLRTPLGPPRQTAGARIDFVLLGLGADGHTASLFPGAVLDSTRWVNAYHIEAESQWRVTLMPAVINAAAQVLFLVAGGAKAAIVRRVLEGPAQPLELPAHSIAPTNGRLLWLLDRDAASDLEDR